VPVRTERSDKWVRAFVGETTVVDSRAPLLYYEEAFPVPGYAFAKADVRTDLLRPAKGEPPREPFFFLPKGPVSQWFDLKVGGRLIPHVAWTRDEPELQDLVVFSWQPGLIDRWLEEEEEVGGHPRDPHKRSKPWLARDTSRSPSTGSCWPTAPLLSSFSKPICRPAITCPREDVQFEALSPSTNRSQCPYKGEADHYWDVAGPVEAKNVAWSYTVSRCREDRR